MNKHVSIIPQVHWDGEDVELDPHEREKRVTSANK